MVLKRPLLASYGLLQLIHRAFNRLNLSTDRLRFGLGFGQIIRHVLQCSIDLIDLVNEGLAVFLSINVGLMQ